MVDHVDTSAVRDFLGVVGKHLTSLGRDQYFFNDERNGDSAGSDLSPKIFLRGAGRWA